MVVKIVVWLLVSIVSALCYRAGGYGHPFRSWHRDWLIPPIIYGYLFFLRQPDTLVGWLMIIPAIGFTGVAISTYWDKLFKFDNYWFHGFMIGLAAFPLYWTGFHWWAIGIRALVLAITVGGWCAIFGNDTVEECGRGAFIAATIPLLLI